jgi:pyruvate/2-oxoacid:ferredoxin oxidoreductase alpha subunit
MVAMDGVVVSHTAMVVDLPGQEQVDRFLPACQVPQRMRADHPTTIGGLTWPRETERHRRDIQQAMDRVPQVLDEALEAFEGVFGRRPCAALGPHRTEDARDVLIACNTISPTLRWVVDERRRRGESVGMINCKLFRPFPRQHLRDALRNARRVGVLDRNHSPGSGGIFWQEVTTSLAGRGGLIVQDYLVGLGGGDVTPEVIGRIIDDLSARQQAEEPLWQEVAS